MQKDQSTIPFQLITFSGVLILVIFYLIRVDLSLVYFANQPFFSTTASFFYSFLKYPGGITQYLSLFAVQFYAIKLLPVMVVVGLFILLSFLTYENFKESKNKSLATITYLLFSVFFISDQGNYFQVPTFLWIGILTLILNLLFIVLKQSTKADFIFFSLIAILVFYLVGLYGLVLFSMMQMGECINQKQPKKAGIFLLLALLPLMVWLLIKMPASGWGALTLLLPFKQITDSKIIILAIPFILFLIILLLPYIKSVDKKLTENQAAKAILIFITWLSVLGILFKLTDHLNLKKQVAVQREAFESNWDKVLSLDNHEINTSYMAMQTCRALYHKHRLLDDLFCFPDYFGDTNLIVTQPMDVATASVLSEFYYDMGFINESRHWANEALTALGYRPDLLKRLITCDIIAGKYATAEKYLNLLKTSLVDRHWAKQQSRYLYSDSSVMANAEYARLRQMNPGVDFFASYTDPYSNLEKIVSDSVQNKMAFEYYIAFNLLRKNSQAVWQQIPKFHQLGYEHLPRSCQEAIVFFKASIGYTATTDLFGYQYDEQIQKRFDEFSDIIFNQFKSDFKAAQSSLVGFKNTYWYYFLYQKVDGVSVSVRGDNNYLN